MIFQIIFHCFSSFAAEEEEPPSSAPSNKEVVWSDQTILRLHWINSILRMGPSNKIIPILTDLNFAWSDLPSLDQRTHRQFLESKFSYVHPSRNEKWWC
jgi:hypothetical protein